MEQEDLDYFERRFDKIEAAVSSAGTRLNALENTTSRHNLIFTAAGTTGLAGFAAWVASLFHK